MKKIAVLFLIVVNLLLCLACNSWYFTGDFDYTFTNNSSQDITIKLDCDNSSYTLSSGENITFNYNHNDSYQVLNHPRISISETFKNHKGKIIFTDLNRYTKSVLNLSNQEIYLSEKNGLIGETYGEYICIPPNTSIDYACYTLAPSYTAFILIENKYVSISLDLLTFY